MYTLTNVTKTYEGRNKVTALNNVNLTIPDGQMVAIEGPTGGGKSTLLQMLGALDVPTQGSILLGDVELSKAKEKDLTQIRADRAHRYAATSPREDLVASLMVDALRGADAPDSRHAALVSFVGRVGADEAAALRLALDELEAAHLDADAVH